jgi:hypothetical protein
VKGRNLRDAGRAALCVDVEAPSFGFVLMEAASTCSDGLEQLRAVCAGGGPATWAPTGPRSSRPAMGSSGGLLARLHPDKVTDAADHAHSE